MSTVITCMRRIQLGRLTLLERRHPDNIQLSEDLRVVLTAVPVDETEWEKTRREAAEERVLALVRLENFGPIGRSLVKVHLAKMLTAEAVGALDRMDFLVM